MKVISFHCPSCGSPLTEERTGPHIYCRYCGNKIMFDDIEFYREDAKKDRLQMILDTIKEITGRQMDKETRDMVVSIIVLLIMLMMLYITYLGFGPMH